jgi:SulP family sulfate permease
LARWPVCICPAVLCRNGCWASASSLPAGSLLRWGWALALLLLGLRQWGEAALQWLGMPAAVASVLVRAAPVVLMLASLLLPRNGRCRWWGRSAQWPAVAACRSFPSRLADLAMPAFFIALINYVQSLSVAQLLAARRQETVDPDRELLALGLCNVAAGLAGGFPVTGGLSRSVVNADAGANSQLASLVTAAGMLLLMFLATAAGPAAAAGAGRHHHCFSAVHAECRQPAARLAGRAGRCRGLAAYLRAGAAAGGG